MHSVTRDMQLLRSPALRTSAGKASTTMPTTSLGIRPSSVFTHFIPLVVPCTDKSPFARPRYNVTTFYSGCAFIPQLLARSSATSELITFLRGGQFERAYTNYNYHSLAGVRFNNFEMEKLVPNVLKAIQNYLQVCSSFSKKVLFLTITHQTSVAILWMYYGARGWDLEWSMQKKSATSTKGFLTTTACIMAMKPKGPNQSLRGETTRGMMTHRDQKNGGGCNNRQWKASMKEI